MTIKVSFDKGLIINDIKKNITFLADPSNKKLINAVSSVFISHAHTDHSLVFPIEDVKVFSTKEASLLYSVLTNKQAKNVEYVEFNKRISVEGIDVEFIPAGHILGATQIIFYFDDKTICYTGDLSTEIMDTVPIASIPSDIDIMIVEATYGNPGLYFEQRDTIKLNLLKWITNNLQNKKVPVLNIGILGGTQEIVSFLNNWMKNVDIFCDDKTSRLNSIYQESGINLKWKNFEKIETIERNSIYILPRGTKKLPDFLQEYNTKRAIITGQSSRFSYSNFDMAFPFSMHSNYYETLDFIKKVSPKKVYTVYGYDKQLAEGIKRDLKIFAQPLRKRKTNYSLDEYLY